MRCGIRAYEEDVYTTDPPYFGAACHISSLGWQLMQACGSGLWRCLPYSALGLGPRGWGLMQGCGSGCVVGTCNEVTAVSPAHGRTEEDRPGVPPGAVRVSAPPTSTPLTAVSVSRDGPPLSTLPDPDVVMEGDGFDGPDGQALIGRLQWDGSSDISPSDSASSKASTNNSDSKKPKKKKKPSLGLNSSGGGVGGVGGGVGGGVVVGSSAGGGGSSSSQGSLVLPSRKKKPKLPAPPTPSIYDDMK
ncbi:hypothetical protein JZ751_028494 [Albula glossodonta]|uniref:Uncharacterized protein n=1 Tax=Albula glossodonta TaxID=121402 RepID=A0A8T2NCQ8_9TELE|nr:hypothetical protein JZ751_028494 [Albula glossodonta]